jgi:hypothetical protein
MSNVLNLVKLGKIEAKKSTSKKKSVLATQAPESTDFLQELTSPVIESICCFKDVNNPVNSGDIFGDFANSRVSMFTLPKGIRYVDYSFDKNHPKFKMGKKGGKSTEKKHMILLYDIGALDNAQLHFCGDNIEPGHPLEDSTHACVDTLTSIRGSDYKPFHVFQAEDLPLLRSFTNKKMIIGDIHLIPFAISEGVVVYFIIDGKDQEVTLQAFLIEILHTQKNNTLPVHWMINSEITYQDAYGIFTCTAIKSVNGVQFGKP